MAIIQPINPTTFEPQQYSEGDKSTIPTLGVNSNFTIEGGRVESAIFDTRNNLVEYNPNAKFSAIENASGKNLEYANTLLIYPEDAVSNLESPQGKYFVIYNFINNELGSSFDQRFRIKEISANRKEIRLTTGFLTEEELREAVNKFYPSNNSPEAYPDFYLNFGQGNLYIANNILFDNTGGQYSILVKLYKPLPSFIEIGSDTNPWICVLQRDTVGYSVEFEQIVFPIKETIDLKGPNFSLDLNNQVHTSTPLSSFNDLNLPSGINSSSITSSYYQLQNLLNNKGIEVNIDYNDFSNFIHFSSAEERVKNFFYKIKLLEDIENDVSSSSLVNSNTYSPQGNPISNKVESIINSFDGFEYWMYYTSSSSTNFPTPYPKKSPTGLPPFKLYSTSSIGVIDWYENAIYSASLYDSENIDNLINTLPSYLIEDPNNESYLTFIKMIGHHFDVLFTYIQDINNRHNADNRLDFGISKDLVGEAIKSMGINLYSGNFTSTDLLSSLIGIYEEGGDINFLPTPEDGNTEVSNYITASNLPTPIENVNKEIYKRIYHNLPLLLKQKGSIAGVRTLINCFGIPKEILDVKEFKIDYLSTTQSLALPTSSSSISFTNENIILPPSFSNYIPSELLSPIIRVQQDYLINETYDRDLHYTEIGYSPQGYFDESLTGSFSPLGEEGKGGNFPDFNEFYFGDDSYYTTKFINTGSTTSSQDVTWDTSAYIRYIKFFDTSLFQMVKDFVPVRNSTATGVIIKPTIKERQRQKPPQLTLENKTYSGSVYTDGGDNRAIGDYDARIKSGSFLSSYAGGSGGTFENLNRYKFGISESVDWSNYDLPTPIRSYFQNSSESIYVTLGYAQQNQILEATSSWGLFKKYDKQEEFYNGEFPQLGQRNVNYLTKEYREEGTDTGLITHDNNAQNPYKHPLNVTHSLSSVTVYSSSAHYIEGGGLTSDLVIANFVDIDIFTLFVKTGTGDLPSSNTMLSNGTHFNYNDGSSNYSFAIGGSYLLGNGIYVGLSVLEPNSEGFQNLLTQASIEYLPPFDSSIYNPGPWAYNEYNPLINNSFDPQAGLVNYNGIRKSTLYQDVDYSPSAPNSLNPINTELLIQGSASKAAVQDSNYLSRWWSNSRYWGNKNSSPDFNIRIIRSVKGINQLYTSESLGFDPLANKLTPDLPSSDSGGK